MAGRPVTVVEQFQCSHLRKGPSVEFYACGDSADLRKRKYEPVKSERCVYTSSQPIAKEYAGVHHSYLITSKTVRWKDKVYWTQHMCFTFLYYFGFPPVIIPRIPDRLLVFQLLSAETIHSQQLSAPMSKHLSVDRHR